MFADDNADMRDYVKRLLGDHWAVEAFGDGAAALASIRRDPPDLVVCDVMMPGLDGYALVRAMRADAALRTIPLVMLSARAGEEETAKALSSGANDYVAKPFSARDLLVRVASQLAERREVARAVARVEASEARFRGLAEDAERANRAKDEFLSTMSHELRTPLNAVLGWATMLGADHADTPKLERGLAVVERNARTLVRLVGDLLDVSRIISGKLRLAIKKTEVSAVVLAALDVVRQAADAKGVRLVVSLDPDTGAILADPDRLQQTVWNLLVNAVKFTPAGGTIRVTTRREESLIRVTVRDDGTGIPRELLPFIFDRFMQVDGLMTRAHGGLGLGLAIVRHLVEAHGGSVEAVSDGPGTERRSRCLFRSRPGTRRKRSSRQGAAATTRCRAVARATGSAFSGAMFSSWRTTRIRWTSSGPSSKARARPLRGQGADGRRSRPRPGRASTW